LNTTIGRTIDSLVVACDYQKTPDGRGGYTERQGRGLFEMIFSSGRRSEMLQQASATLDATTGVHGGTMIEFTDSEGNPQRVEVLGFTARRDKEGHVEREFTIYAGTTSKGDDGQPITATIRIGDDGRVSDIVYNVRMPNPSGGSDMIPFRIEHAKEGGAYLIIPASGGSAVGTLSPELQNAINRASCDLPFQVGTGGADHLGTDMRPFMDTYVSNMRAIASLEAMISSEGLRDGAGRRGEMVDGLTDKHADPHEREAYIALRNRVAAEALSGVLGGEEAVRSAEESIHPAGRGDPSSRIGALEGSALLAARIRQADEDAGAGGVSFTTLVFGHDALAYAAGHRSYSKHDEEGSQQLSQAVRGVIPDLSLAELTGMSRDELAGRLMAASPGIERDHALAAAGALLNGARDFVHELGDHHTPQPAIDGLRAAPISQLARISDLGRQMSDQGAPDLIAAHPEIIPSLPSGVMQPAREYAYHVMIAEQCSALGQSVRDLTDPRTRMDQGKEVVIDSAGVEHGMDWVPPEGSPGVVGVGEEFNRAREHLVVLTRQLAEASGVNIAEQELHPPQPHKETTGAGTVLVDPPPAPPFHIAGDAIDAGILHHSVESRMEELERNYLPGALSPEVQSKLDQERGKIFEPPKEILEKGDEAASAYFEEHMEQYQEHEREASRLAREREAETRPFTTATAATMADAEEVRRERILGLAGWQYDKAKEGETQAPATPPDYAAARAEAARAAEDYSAFAAAARASGDTALADRFSHAADAYRAVLGEFHPPNEELPEGARSYPDRLSDLLGAAGNPRELGQGMVDLRDRTERRREDSAREFEARVMEMHASKEPERKEPKGDK
jgi:hypothetical protein